MWSTFWDQEVQKKCLNTYLPSNLQLKLRPSDNLSLMNYLSGSDSFLYHYSTVADIWAFLKQFYYLLPIKCYTQNCLVKLPVCSGAVGENPGRSDHLIGWIFFLLSETRWFPASHWIYGSAPTFKGVTWPCFHPICISQKARQGGKGVLFTPEALHFVLASGGGVI